MHTHSCNSNHRHNRGLSHIHHVVFLLESHSPWVGVLGGSPQRKQKFGCNSEVSSWAARMHVTYGSPLKDWARSRSPPRHAGMMFPASISRCFSCFCQRRTLRSVALILASYNCSCVVRLPRWLAQFLSHLGRQMCCVLCPGFTAAVDCLRDVRCLCTLLSHMCVIPALRVSLQLQHCMWSSSPCMVLAAPQ